MKTILTIITLVTLIFAQAAPAENIDPIHDGKRLSEWFAEFSQTPAYVTPATKAIQAIGSNAVPYLVQFLGPNETNSWTERAAMSALDALGDKAQAATPALVFYLNDQDPKVAADAAYSLARIGSPAKSALPELQALLQKNRGDAYGGLAAVTALWSIDKGQAPLVVEALGEMLFAGGRWGFNYNVLETLREVGPTAKASIPALERGLREEQLADYWQTVAATIVAVDSQPAEEKGWSNHVPRIQPGLYRCDQLLAGSSLSLLLMSDGKYSASEESREKVQGRENGTWKQASEELLLTREVGNLHYDLRRFKVDDRFPNTLGWLPAKGFRVGAGAVDFPMFKRVKLDWK
jgi:hypothetical protein